MIVPRPEFPSIHAIILYFCHGKIDIAELRVPACIIDRVVSNPMSNVSDIVLCYETFLFLIMS